MTVTSRRITVDMLDMLFIRFVNCYKLLEVPKETFTDCLFL